MPNSRRVHDHNHGPIEAAIKETARGRAFLAEYARRVRQSDTMTMLAMIGRLERLCQDHAVRLAELSGYAPMSGGRAIESHTGPALKSRIDQTVPLAGHADGSLVATNSSNSAGMMCDRDPAFADQLQGYTGAEFAGVDQNREALDRIEHLADTLRNLDRKITDLTNRCGATGAYSETGLLADIAAVESGGETTIVQSAEFDASERLRPRALDSKEHHSEDEVLDDIAKALGTIRR